MDNVIVVDDTRVLNTGGLRYDDESVVSFDDEHEAPAGFAELAPAW